LWQKNGLDGRKNQGVGEEKWGVGPLLHFPQTTGLLLYLKNLGIDWKILHLFLNLLFKDQQKLFFQVLQAPT